MLHLSELVGGRHLLMSIKRVLLGVISSTRNPVGTGLTALTIIAGINKNPVNPVILSKKPFRRELN